MIKKKEKHSGEAMSLKTRKQQKNVSEIKTMLFEKSSQINKPQLTQPR
jgi:hypothetical protein